MLYIPHLRGGSYYKMNTQETHSSTSSAALWEREWGGSIIYSHGSQNSRGVAILLARNFSPAIITQISDHEGRFLGADLELEDHSLSVCSIYAPTQDKPKDQISFFNNMQGLVEELNGTDLILAGDFNCTLNPRLDKSTAETQADIAGLARARIESLKEEMDLTDVWRVRNPMKRGYTFSRGPYSSRLDYFLVSDHLADRVSSMDINNLVHSDHAMISMALNQQDSTRGPGLWRFDVDLLLDKKFPPAMLKFISDWEPPQEIQSPNSRWELLKFNMKGFILDFTKRKRAEANAHLKLLEEDLKTWHRNNNEGQDTSLTERESLEREIREIEEAKARKMIFRSRSNWTLYGEKPSIS